MPQDEQQIHWIKDYLATSDSNPSEKIDTDMLAKAQTWLEDTENLFAVLNNLDEKYIPAFINQFLRPVGQTKAYDKLASAVENDKGSDLELICYAIVGTNTVDYYQDIKKAFKNINDKSSEKLKVWLADFLNLAKRHENPRKYSDNIPDKIDFINLSGLNQPRFRLRSIKLNNCVLDHADMENINLRHISLSSCHAQYTNFNHTNLSSAYMVHSNLSCSSFDHSKLMRILLTEATLSGATFYKANLKRGSLEATEMDGTSFSCANMDQVNMSHANGRNAFFTNARLTWASLNEVTLQYCHFNNAIMNNSIMRKGNFQHSTFVNGQLKKVDLSFADLSHASFENVDLSGANLSNANLKNTSLKNVMLSHAAIKDADITDTTFEKTQFFNEITINHASAVLKKELSWWEEQISNLNQTKQRSLKHHILGDLISKAKSLPDAEKKLVFDIAFRHPLFKQRRQSLSGSMNLLFNNKSIMKTSAQKILEKELLPPKQSQTIGHLRIRRMKHV